jgi:hypothetical protein
MCCRCNLSSIHHVHLIDQSYIGFSMQSVHGKHRTSTCSCLPQSVKRTAIGLDARSGCNCGYTLQSVPVLRHVAACMHATAHACMHATARMLAGHGSTQSRPAGAGQNCQSRRQPLTSTFSDSRCAGQACVAAPGPLGARAAAGHLQGAACSGGWGAGRLN